MTLLSFLWIQCLSIIFFTVFEFIIRSSSRLSTNFHSPDDACLFPWIFSQSCFPLLSFNSSQQKSLIGRLSNRSCVMRSDSFVDVNSLLSCLINFSIQFLLFTSPLTCTVQVRHRRRFACKHKISYCLTVPCLCYCVLFDGRTYSFKSVTDSWYLFFFARKVIFLH